MEVPEAPQNVSREGIRFTSDGTVGGELCERMISGTLSTSPFCMPRVRCVIFFWVKLCQHPRRQKTTRYFNYDQCFDILPPKNLKVAWIEKPPWVFVDPFQLLVALWHLITPLVFLKRTTLGELTTLRVAMAGQSLRRKP